MYLENAFKFACITDRPATLLLGETGFFVQFGQEQSLSQRQRTARLAKLRGRKHRRSKLTLQIITAILHQSGVSCFWSCRYHGVLCLVLQLPWCTVLLVHYATDTLKSQGSYYTSRNKVRNGLIIHSSVTWLHFSYTKCT